jgi:hypothetical protein
VRAQNACPCSAGELLSYRCYEIPAEGKGEKVLDLNPHLFCIQRRKSAAPSRVTIALKP